MKRGVTIVQGDLLNAKETYIAQQCNCLTVRAKGLCHAIAQRYPWADPYATRTSIGDNRNCAVEADRDEPGTIRILTDPSNTSSKRVICMFAQWTPGKPGMFKSYPKWSMESHAIRKVWFSACLKAMRQIDTDAIAFPCNIGCGLAGGHWDEYVKMIEEFARVSGIDCVIYKLK